MPTGSLPGCPSHVEYCHPCPECRVRRALDNGASFEAHQRPAFPSTDWYAPGHSPHAGPGPAGEDPAAELTRTLERLSRAPAGYRPFFAAAVIAAQARLASPSRTQCSVSATAVPRADSSRMLEVALLSSSHPWLEYAGDMLADADARLRQALAAAITRSMREVEQLALVADQYRLSGALSPDSELSPGWQDQAAWACEALRAEELALARYDAFALACSEFAAEMGVLPGASIRAPRRPRLLWRASARLRRDRGPAYTTDQVRAALSWDPKESWSRHFDGF